MILNAVNSNGEKELYSRNVTNFLTVQLNVYRNFEKVNIFAQREQLCLSYYSKHKQLLFQKQLIPVN